MRRNTGKEQNKPFLTITIDKSDVDNSEAFLQLLSELLSAEIKMKRYIQLKKDLKYGKHTAYGA